jgi:hypothetical protein
MSSWEELQECVAHLETQKSPGGKITVLKNFPHLKPLFQMCTNPLLKTRLSRNSVLNYERYKFPKFHESSHDEYPLEVEPVLTSLITGQITGDDAKEMVVIVMRHHPHHRELILRVIEKDLKVRVGPSLVHQGCSIWR